MVEKRQAYDNHWNSPCGMAFITFALNFEGCALFYHMYRMWWHEMAAVHQLNAPCMKDFL